MVFFTFKTELKSFYFSKSKWVFILFAKEIRGFLFRKKRWQRRSEDCQSHGVGTANANSTTKKYSLNIRKRSISSVRTVPSDCIRPKACRSMSSRFTSSYSIVFLTLFLVVILLICRFMVCKVFPWTMFISAFAPIKIPCNNNSISTSSISIPLLLTTCLMLLFLGLSTFHRPLIPLPINPLPFQLQPTCPIPSSLTLPPPPPPPPPLHTRLSITPTTLWLHPHNPHHQPPPPPHQNSFMTIKPCPLKSNAPNCLAID